MQQPFACVRILLLLFPFISLVSIPAVFGQQMCAPADGTDRSMAIINQRGSLVFFGINGHVGYTEVPGSFVNVVCSGSRANLAVTALQTVCAINTTHQATCWNANAT